MISRHIGTLVVGLVSMLALSCTQSLLGQTAKKIQTDGVVKNSNSPDTLDSKKAETGKQFKVASAPPVRRIVFFNSGIAQVLHQGQLAGDQAIEIQFDRDQIDDVLKSLVFDTKSGTVESVQYQPAPGKESLASKKLGPAMTLAQTLQNFRGEQITLKLEESEAKGAILGVETRTNGDNTEEIVTLLTEQGLKPFKLDRVKSMQFQSQKLQDQFRLAMVGLSNARDVQQEKLTMYFEGKAKRPVQFGYVVDAPVWRMTYRLDVNKKKAKLQGWAHIDNITGFDWKDVYIDLRSGRPQAFNVELFAPLMARREKRSRSIFGIPADLNLVAKYFGNSSQGALTGNRYGRGGFGGAMGGFGGGGQGGGGGGMGGVFGSTSPSEAEDARRPIDLDQGFENVAEQAMAAKMLQFAIEKPINLESGRSAMVPIMDQGVEVDLLTQFDLTSSDPSARLVAKIKNGDKFSIVAGPITLYQDGGFIGDSALPRTYVGQEVVLEYGDDLPLSISVVADENENILKRIRLDESAESSTLIVESIVRAKRKFSFVNQDTSSRRVQLLVSTRKARLAPEPANLKNNVAEFVYELKADSTKQHAITFETDMVKSVRPSSIKPETVEAWKKEDVEIEPEAQALLDRYFELDQQRLTLSIKRTELDSRINVLLGEQKRLTEIISAVKSEGTAAPFVKQLLEQEEQLSDARKEYEGVNREYEAKRLELTKLVEREQSSNQAGRSKGKNKQKSKSNDNPFQ